MTSPAPGASLPGDSVEIRGRSARPHAPLRVSVAVGPLELGVVHLKADRAGAFAGRVPLLPRPRSARATLWVHEAASSFLLAEVPVRLDGPAAVSIWSPLPRETVDPSVEVSGCALPAVRGISASARLPSGVGTEVIMALPDETVVGACRSFDLVLPLQADLAKGRTLVRLGWRVRGSSTVFTREIPVHVVPADR